MLKTAAAAVAGTTAWLRLFLAQAAKHRQHISICNLLDAALHSQTVVLCAASC
jgi:hypothetical protein